jgi:hypothetical protein
MRDAEWLTSTVAEEVQRAPITWLGKTLGVLVAITVMAVLLLPFAYVYMFP